jgi:hypothetical protein
MRASTPGSRATRKLARRVKLMENPLSKVFRPVGAMEKYLVMRLAMLIPRTYRGDRIKSALVLAASGNAVLDLSALERAEEALPFADWAMRVEPEGWTCVVTKGYALLKLGRFAEAGKLLARWEPHFFELPDSFVG